MKEETQLSVLQEIRDLLKKESTVASVPEAIKAAISQDTITLNIPQGATIEGVLAECKKLFPVWRYTDRNLDETITSERTTENAYTITFKNLQEADEDMKSISANDIKEKGISGITLLERLVMELEYFKDTGNHLDIDNWTLCAGSRDSDGSVPRVDWCDGKLRVYWTLAGSRRSDLRARVAVS